MTSPNTIDRTTRRLLSQLAVIEGVLNGSLATVCVDRLQKEAFATAKDLREEMAAPVQVAPWTPWKVGAGK